MIFAVEKVRDRPLTQLPRKNFLGLQPMAKFFGSFTGHETFMDREDENLKRYLKEVKRYPVLSAQEEHDLAVKAQNGDSLAREHFIKCNLRMVVSIANRYMKHGMPLLDIIQEGNCGLIEAVEHFDTSLGCRFSTLATIYVKKYIRNALWKKEPLIHIPESERCRIADEAKAQEKEYRSILGYESVKSVATVMPVDSLDQVVNDGSEEDGDAVFTLEDKVSLSVWKVDSVQSSKDRDELIRYMLCKLSERSHRVVSLNYGINDGYGDGFEHAPESIASEIGVGAERVRQILKQAKAKLKEIANDHIKRHGEAF